MRVFALILINLIFFIVIGPLLLALNLQFTILSSSAYLKESLVKTNAYDRLSSFAADDLLELLQNDERDPESQISTAQLQQILASIPPATIQKVAEQGLDAYFESAQAGGSVVPLDISEIKARTFGTLPAELKAEVDKSVPDTYNIQLTKKHTGFWKMVFNKTYRYYGMAFTGLLIILALLLGNGWKGKLRSVGSLLLLGGIVAVSLQYILSFISISQLAKLVTPNASQKLMTLAGDILDRLMLPVIQLFRNEWMFGFGLALLLFIITWVISEKRLAAAGYTPTPSGTIITPPADADQPSTQTK